MWQAPWSFLGTAQMNWNRSWHKQVSLYNILYIQVQFIEKTSITTTLPRRGARKFSVSPSESDTPAVPFCTTTLAIGVHCVAAFYMTDIWWLWSPKRERRCKMSLFAAWWQVNHVWNKNDFWFSESEECTGTAPSKIVLFRPPKMCILLLGVPRWKTKAGQLQGLKITLWLSGASH